MRIWRNEDSVSGEVDKNWIIIIMKTLEALKNMGVIRNLGNLSSNDKNNRISESTKEFSFSPNKSSDHHMKLADFLSSKPSALQSTETRQKPNEIFKKSNTKSKTIGFDKSKTPQPDNQKFSTSSKSPNNSHTFKPLINPNSIRLLRNAEKEGRDPHLKKTEKINPQPNPVEPVVEQKKHISLKEFLNRNYTQELIKVEAKNKHRPVTPLDKLDEHCTFKPSLDLKSREMTETHRVDLYELGLRKNEEKKALIETTLRKKEIEELKDCTFTPKIMRKFNVLSRVESKFTPTKTLYSTKCYRNVSPLTIETVDCLDELNED